MRHMLEENVGLTTTRINRQASLGYFFITSWLTDVHILDNARDSTSLFPLYIYPDKNKRDLFNQHQIEKEPNIPPALFENYHPAMGRNPHRKIFSVNIYGIFYSNIYRETYAEFLKIDFPRVPFTADYDLFKKLGKLGRDWLTCICSKARRSLRRLPDTRAAAITIGVEKITYKEDEQRIYINKDKYFEGIAPEVWNYHIGGYQVLNKYLKDRKGRNMDDAPHYCRIVTALSKTLKIQKR